MSIFGFIAFVMLILTAVFLVAAVQHHPGWYWAAGTMIYVFSFLGSFSIGLLTLSLTFCCFALAIAHQFRWIAQWKDRLITIVSALAAWLICIRYIDDQWLFFPFHYLLNRMLAFYPHM